MKQIIIGFLFGLIFKGYSQKVINTDFVDYDKVIENILDSVSIIDLEKAWNYEFVLLLDTTEIDRIKEIRPIVVADFRDNYSSPILNKYTKLIPTDLKSVKDCFANENFQNLILNNTALETDLSDKKLKFPIYIKDDKMAVYEIYGKGWSECDKIAITDCILKRFI